MQAIQLTIRSDPRELPPVRAAVEKSALAAGFDAPEASNVVLAIDEALTNVFKHGYEGNTEQMVELSIQTLTQPRPGIRICIRDFGKQVSPESICGRDLDDVKPGGLGVHIMRSIMDEVVYTTPADGGMHLELSKFKKP
jgi:anti-sigma regulatory factor (Ser/Thr protein kinase)